MQSLRTQNAPTPIPGLPRQMTRSISISTHLPILAFLTTVSMLAADVVRGLGRIENVGKSLGLVDHVAPWIAAAGRYIRSAADIRLG